MNGWGSQQHPGAPWGGSFMRAPKVDLRRHCCLQVDLTAAFLIQRAGSCSSPDPLFPSPDPPAGLGHLFQLSIHWAPPWDLAHSGFPREWVPGPGRPGLQRKLTWQLLVARAWLSAQPGPVTSLQRGRETMHLGSRSKAQAGARDTRPQLGGDPRRHRIPSQQVSTGLWGV